jgi:O-antigen ligase
VSTRLAGGRLAWGNRRGTARFAVGKPIAALIAIGAVAAIVAGATRAGREVEVAGGAVALFGFVLSLRWPLLPLFIFAVLIPFEQAVFIEGVGTLSRYAAIMFVLVYGLPRIGRLRISAMPLAGWGYVAWAIFSAAWAIDPTATWSQIPAIALLFIVAVLVAVVVVDHPTIVRPLLWTYTISAAATGALGILSYVASIGPIGANARVAGLANQDPAFYAAILLPALVLAFYELLYGRWLLPSAAVILVSTVGIVISGTRGAWLSVVVVIVMFIFPRLHPARRIAATAVVLAVLAITLQIPGVSTLVGLRTETALSTGGAGRTDIWSIGFGIFGSAPVTGVGLDNFSVANTPERVRDTAVSTGTVQSLANLGPHNIVVGTLAELGFVGLVLLAAFLVPLVVRRGWGPDAAVVQAALASLLVMAMFLDVLARKELWLLIGLACGLAYLARHGPVSERAAARGVDVASMRARLRWPVGR